VGVACANGIFPEYSFSSSRPDIGDFVAPNLASANPLAVLLNAQEEPVHDSSSGLFCAFNAGTTVVTISAGGLSASLPVTVQPGSVRRPCGTKPLKELPAKEQQVPTPVSQPQPTPAGASPTPVPVPLPAPPANPPAPSAKVAVPAFFLPAGSNGPLLAALPPPVPTPARPTPPGGTSSVTTPVEAPEKQEEKEEATESVSNQALSYDATEHEPASGYIIGIVLLAAFAGACARRRPRRDRREARIAPATISGIHSQRRMSDRGRRRGR